MRIHWRWLYTVLYTLDKLSDTTALATIYPGFCASEAFNTLDTLITCTTRWLDTLDTLGAVYSAVEF